MRFKKTLRKFTALALAVVMTANFLIACSSANSDTKTSDSVYDVGDSSWAPDYSSSDSTFDKGADIEETVISNKPDKMRAFTLTAGVDYITDSRGYEDICGQVYDIFENLRDTYFNSVIINLFDNNGKAIFKSDSCGYISDFDGDLLKSIYTSAVTSGYYVYFGFQINQYSGINPCKNNVPVFDGLLTALLGEYTSVSGIIFSDYGFVTTESVYSEYAEEASFQGIENYKADRLTSFVCNASKLVESISRDLLVGFSIDGDSAYFEGSLNSYGYCNADDWIIHNYFGCAAISCSLSFDNGFNTQLDTWYEETSDTKCVRYISLDPENEEFASQYITASQKDFDGLILDKTAVLTANSDLMKTVYDADEAAFSGVAEQSKNTTLKISSPTSKSVSTYESKYSFCGSCDPAYPLYINDSLVPVSSDGYFSYEVSLEIGKNTFTIKHKDIENTYSVTYKLQIISDVSPTKDTYVDGSSLLSVKAICLKGSSVTAELNGQKITMSVYNDSSDVDANGESYSDYVTYTGIFSTPESSNKVKNLGKIKFTATYSGQSETASGGKIYLNVLPQAPIETSPELSFGDVELGKTYYVAQINKEQAETFNGDTTDNRSRSVNAYLPKGTLDYCSSSNIVNSDASGTYGYRLLDYGKRVYSYTSSSRGETTDYINILYGALPSYNAISVFGTSFADRHTYITLNTLWKAPFNVTLAPQEYEGTDKNPAEYNVSSTTYEYIEFSFAYCTAASGTVDLSNNAVFSRSEWVKGSDGTFALRLYLKNKGKFYGWGASYNDNGQLVLSFLNPAQISTASNDYGYSLENTVIMLDPGHGGSDVGATGIAISPSFYESSLNMMLSIKVKNILESLGATVIMTRSNDSNVSLNTRNALVRQYKPDIFISFHRNASTSTSASGYSVYYYEPYSMQLAKEIGTRCNELKSGNRNLLNYSPPMQVCRVSDCPAILTENWFLTNSGDYNMIITSEFNDLIADATVKGIIAYFCFIKQ